ncbi:MAG TPA: AgmX/PglI C-terminal domain-containing protein [Pseudomonadales bacterium]
MKYGFYDMTPVLPWHGQPKEDRRFRRILIALLIISLLFSIVVGLSPRPVIDRQKTETIPPRLAKLLLERQQIPPPPKIEPAKEKEKEKPPEKEKPEAKKPEKKKPLTDDQNQARKAAKKEIAAFSSILAELSDIKPIPAANKQLKNTGQQAAKTERSLITSRATTSSGGVSTQRASQASTNTQALASTDSTKVSSNISNITAAETASGGSDHRSREQINRVFDNNKGALYALYNRALRKNPSLSGEVSFHIEISPEGIVTSCKVTSSEIDDQELLRKLAARIKLFNFGSAEVQTWKDIVIWDFIPS